MKYKRDDLVYVNGLHGEVTTSRNSDNHYHVTFKNGKSRWYPENKLIKRYPHCQDCNRRITNGDKCDYCKST